MAILHMAGSDGFITDGERLLADELRLLPAEWVVIANKMLPVHGGVSREIDFIVVGDQLVFVLDEKGYGGRIHGSDQQWTLSDGSSLRSPLNKLEQSARLVNGFLDRRIPVWHDHNGEVVVSGVVLSRTDQRPFLSDPRAARSVMLLSEVRERLLAWDAAGPVQRHKGTAGTPAPVDLAKRYRRTIDNALFDLSSRPKVPRRVNDYEIISSLDGPAGSRIFLARHELGGERVLTMYDIGSDPGRQAFVRHEVETLRQLQPTGVVPEMLDPFSWSEQFLVVPTIPPIGTSVGALPGPTTPADARLKIRIAAASMRALARIHAAGVVHRALNPDRVVVRTVPEGSPPAVVFTQFFAARNTGGTIAHELGSLGLDDPYAAPEIIALGAEGYGFVNASSDTYTLALIWLEQLSGQRLAALRPFPMGADESNGSLGRSLDIRIPDASQAWKAFPEDLVVPLREFFQRVLTAGGLARAGSTAAQRLTAAECADALDALSGTAPAERPGTTVVRTPGERLENRYRVIRTLGVGSSAFTYLVQDDVDGDFYAVKQLMRPAVLSLGGVAAAEFRTLKQLSHRCIPRVFDIYPATHPFHIKMEYVAGRELRAALGDYRSNLESWRRLSGDLLSAVGYLEQHGVRHRDIKPENVILRDDGSAVLVDFGIATTQGAATGPAGTPGYLPPETMVSATPPDSVDRYALAVVLFEALFGRKPFVADAGVVQEPIALATVDCTSDIERAIAKVLLGAVIVDPTERPSSMSRLAEAIEIALHLDDQPRVVEVEPELEPVGGKEPDRTEDDPAVTTKITPETAHQRETAPDLRPASLTEKTNPVVVKLRSLFRNSDGGNADNRGLDSDFARETYVPTRLDETVLPAVLRERPRVVFLSGNPGDGKTAFLEQIREALRSQGGREISGDASGWEWRLAGHTFRSCYDASESHDGLTADEQVLGRLAGLEGDQKPAAELTVLIAINDGRLVALQEQAEDRFGWLVRSSREARDRQARLDAGGVWLIDLKRRSVVGLSSVANDLSLMRKVLDRLVAPAAWDACLGCVAFDACPIRRNAAALRSDKAVAGPSPADRLEHLMRISHLRGVRHLTIRDIRSGLAYLITGGRTCDDVHAARSGVIGATMPGEYWRSVFTTTDETDVMLGQFVALDPARSPQPFLERYLYFHRDIADRHAREALFADGADVPLASLGTDPFQEEPDATPDLAPAPADTEEAIRWVSAVKQRLFFHGRLPGDDALASDGQPVPAVRWVSLLPYRENAGQFMNGLRYPEDIAELLPTLLHGISRSDGVRDAINGDGLAVRVAASEVNRLTIVKRFPVAQFRLEPDAVAGRSVLESIPMFLWLIHDPSRARLRVTLDLFEMLSRLADGQEPDADELQPLLEDLVAFKSRISLHESRDFYLIEDNRRRHLLTQEGGRIILRTDIDRTGAARGDYR